MLSPVPINLTPHLTPQSAYISSAPINSLTPSASPSRSPSPAPTDSSNPIPVTTPETSTYHIFFIPGNPGCMGYYHSFISLLAGELDADASCFSATGMRGGGGGVGSGDGRRKRRVHVFGHSLGGFVDGGENWGKGEREGKRGKKEDRDREESEVVSRATFRAGTAAGGFAKEKNTGGILEGKGEEEVGRRDGEVDGDERSGSGSGYEDDGEHPFISMKRGQEQGQRLKPKQKHKEQRILSLREQIEYVESVLDAYVHAQSQSQSQSQSASVSLTENARRNRNRKGELKIILVGHSVGAYMGLEVLRRWREREREKREKKKDSAGAAGDRDGDGIAEQKMGGEEMDMEMKIVGFVGLWPTVTWIGRSKSGRQVGWLLRIPYFALAIETLVRCLTYIVNRSMMEWLVELFTGFPNDAVRTTTDFLRHPGSVQQALHMARDEMNEITEDRWDEDLWGAAERKEGSPRPKLVFYFGKDDHWVADHSRDELIAARAFQKGQLEGWRPKMLVDDEGIPHSFCIRHSATTARKVARFVEEIVQADHVSSPIP